MTRTRLPLIPTLVVASATIVMLGLGIWQLERRSEKEALLARLSANRTLPAIAFPRIPQGDALLFRRASGFCLGVTWWQAVGGHDAQGQSGWRQIAHCRTGAEGPGIIVQAGVSTSPRTPPNWRGGEVRGYISHAPSALPAIARVFGGEPQTLMLVADPPVPGLRANGAPDPASVPNNHLAYAVQWFIFATLAVGIYLFIVTRRARGAKG